MKRLLLIIPFLAYASVALGANIIYVRDGGTGASATTGWAGAYDQATAAEAVANRTTDDVIIYVADGSYTGGTFNVAASGTRTITVRKATVADHGTSTGWSDAYGDGVAEFTTGISVTTNYWIFDGQVGSGRSGHGFKFTTTDTGASKLLTVSGGASHLAFRHIDFQHRGEDQEVNQDCVYMNSSGSSDITFADCALHDVSRVMVYMGGVRAALFENCEFYNRHDSAVPAIHGEAFSINNSGLNAGTVIRNCVFDNIDGTGIIVIKDSIQSGFDIYGNTFRVSGSSSRYTPSQGVICNTSGDTTTGVRFHHNTMRGLPGTSGILFYGGDSSNIAQNNIWWDCPDVSLTGVIGSFNARNGSLSGSNNVTLSSNPFVSSADLHLTSGTAAGSVLGSPFNVDPDGKIRGADGTLDRGAYEFDVAGGETDITQPIVTITGPTSSATYASSSTPLAIAGTASDAVGVVSVTWSNAAGGSGVATGTTSWSDTVPLSVGANAITVTAHDAAGNTGTDTITITYTPPAGGEITVGTANVQVITVSP